MLGSVEDVRSSREGDINPRSLAVVVLISGLMTLAIGAGMLLTGSGDSGQSANPPGSPEFSKSRTREERFAVPPQPVVAPAPAANVVPAPPNIVLPPVPPHAVQVPVIVADEPVAPHVYPQSPPPPPAR
ncbi:hypothetical protein AB0N05_36720 [Nocardia sp. NPDC051030]|uniref:hypothetical protein n=1 Tax=Nocardia sp. NPDC051030 TaxID=3155162 RepID=UPI00342F3715